jgi:hypothetical protein
MSLKEKFICDPIIFEECWAFLEKAFYLDRSLPDQVFKENYTGFLVDDTTWLPWEILSSSTLGRKKELITIACLDPEPKEDFRLFGHYPVFQLSNHADYEEYMSMLWLEVESNVEPMQSWFRGSNKVVWLPESLEWAAWQSYDLEVCIIAFNKETGADKIPFNPDWWPVQNNWMTAETVIKGLMRQVFLGKEVPEDIAVPFLKNYGGQGYENRL